MADCQLGDFVIKIDEALDDDLAGARAATFLCVVPRGLNIIC